MRPFHSIDTLLFLAALLAFTNPSTARAVPAIKPSNKTVSLLPTTADPHHNPLMKRHDYALICKDANKEGQMVEDIPLSRRCLAMPYSYRCDRDGKFYNDGLDDDECDMSCECKNTSTDMKPRCISLGGGSGDFYWCW